MKTALLAVLLTAISIQTKSQTTGVLELFKQVNVATQQIKSGQVELRERYSKISIGEDTTRRLNTYDFYFKRNPSDTLIGYKILSKSKSGLQRLYDGKNLFQLTQWNKTLEITPVQNNIKDILGLKQTTSTFPMFVLINTIFQNAIKNLKNSKWELRKDKVNYHNIACYQVNIPPQIGEQSKTTVSYYISAHTFIPLGQVVTFETSIGDAKEVQTFETWMTNSKLNLIVDDEQFVKESLAEYEKEITINSASTVVNSTLLKVGSLAPDWELPLLTGGNLKLSDLKGKVVILDFWYKACIPCQRQMIALQQLHDKFEKSKVVFIGVNTKDDPLADKLELFIKLRKLTMTNVYNGNKIEKAYKVYASPALFLINQNGEVVFSQDGYSDTLLKDLANKIEQLL